MSMRRGTLKAASCAHRNSRSSSAVTLAPGESYTGPWVYAAYGDGLDGVAARFHAFLRSRRHHPRRPRPVVCNTWEAVYFDHDLGRLTEREGVTALPLFYCGTVASTRRGSMRHTFPASRFGRRRPTRRTC